QDDRKLEAQPLVRRFDGHIVPSRPPCRFYDGADFEWQDSDFTSTARKAGAQKSASGAKPEAADLERSFRSAPEADLYATASGLPQSTEAVEKRVIRG